MSSRPQTIVALLLVVLFIVGGCVAPGLEPVQPPPSPSLTAERVSVDDFSAQVRQAVEAKDLTAMRSLMDADLFVIAFWPGNSLPPLSAEDATGQLSNLHMTAGPITFPEADAPLSDLLDGQDPLHVFQSDVQVVDVLFSQGWGAEGLGEAMLFLAQRPDGSFWWYSIIIAPTGFPRVM